MSDFYDPNAYQGQDDMSFLAELFGSPQYQDPSMGMPGSTFANRLSNLKGIEGLLGIPITQLMGGGSVGSTGTPQPMQQPSYNEQVYGSNPMFADAFAAIKSGVDPESVYQEILNKHKEYGINFDESDIHFQDWADRTFKVINDYAFENKKNAGEYDQAMQAWGSDPANMGDQFTIAGKKYQGSPDINGFASQADLMGAPDLNTLMQATAEKRRMDNTPRVSDPFAMPEARDGLSMDEFMQHQKSGGQRNATVRHQDPLPTDSVAWPSSLVLDAFMERQQSSGGGAAPKGRGHQGSTDWMDPSGRVFGNSQAAGRTRELEQYQAKYDKVHLNKALNKAKGTMVRSDANAEAMRKVLAMRALLGA